MLWIELEIGNMDEGRDDWYEWDGLYGFEVEDMGEVVVMNGGYKLSWSGPNWGTWNFEGNSCYTQNE